MLVQQTIKVLHSVRSPVCFSNLIFLKHLIQLLGIFFLKYFLTWDLLLLGVTFSTTCSYLPQLMLS